MRGLSRSALLGSAILLTACGATSSKSLSPAVTSVRTVASPPTATTQPPPTSTTTVAPTTTTLPSTTTTTRPTASFASITSDLQKLVRFGALPGAAAVPNALVNCPPVPVKTGSYFACNVDSQSIGDAQFLGQITNAAAGTFTAIVIGPDVTCSSFNAAEVLAMRSIGGCAPAVAMPPTVEINGVAETKPSMIGFSADGGNIPYDLVWSGWGSATATAQGIVGLNNCTPDCAQGKILTVPVLLSVTDLYADEYHSITEQVQGQAPQTFQLPYSS